MPIPAPFLRAPPFPGVAPHVAQVSATRAGQSAAAPREVDATALIAALRRERVGGTFWARALPASPGPLTLLRPQTLGESRAMAAEALRDADPAKVVALLPLKAWARSERGRLERDGIAAAIGDVDPWPLLGPDTLLLAHGDDEWVLLTDIAGGRTRLRSAGRFAPADPSTLERRIEAALLKGVVYRDPFTGQPADALQTVALLGEWRRLIDANRGIAVAAGMAVWKRREIERFLWAGRERPLRFVGSAGAAVREAALGRGAIAVWPSRRPAGLDRLAAARRIPIHTVEDGFIRSVGLGAACVPPLSIAVDSQGIHYDPSRPSDLETILADHAFTPAELARAEALIAFVVEHGIGKYDVDHAAPAAPEASRSRPRILVTGQVEDDLSVRLGGAGVTGNLDLLARARAAEPDAELWYRPHPDVDAGLRVGAVPDADALRYAERVVRGGSMARLLGQVDGIHVLTSLAGFEALLRGLAVTVHGQPFFSGWGLTRDFAATMFRRKRRLSLPELVAGVLILYPRYIDPVTGLPCPPERMTERLVQQGPVHPSLLTRARRLQGQLLRTLGQR